MQGLFSILMVVISLVIFWEDFSSRYVHTFLFVLLALCGLLYNGIHTGYQETLRNSLTNGIFLAAQFLLVLLYFRFIRKRQQPVGTLAGMGDLLFLMACCFYFPPVLFVCFYMGSLLFSLLLHFLFMPMARYRRPGSSVALAGWQALFLAIIMASTAITGCNIMTFSNTLLTCFQ